MRVLLQRVSEAAVYVDGREISRIGRGFLLLVGITHDDREEEAAWLAKKTAGLRVFEDSDGKMNLGLQDVAGEVLVVSQFTLYGDVRKGRRPAFVDAVRPDHAEPMMSRFCDFLRLEGLNVKEGSFGAMMQISLVNDGPVTLMLERAAADRS
ncbi:MAG: D-aminoacyl-tRNA deacylase [bacterium]